MRRKLSTAILFYCFSCSHAGAQNFSGNPPGVHFKQINTATARVIFPAGLDSQANRIHNMIALLNKNLVSTIGNRNRKWNVVLQNQTTISNAYVRLAPVMSEFYMMPGQDNFKNGSIRWDDNLATHENRHMQQLSNFNKGITRLFSFFLGQEGQLLANGITIPDYFFEGDAVWQETLVGKQGRGRMPWFYNGFRALWNAGTHYSWMKLRSGSYVDYTPDHYQLGYLLVAYGNERYGPGFWKNVTGDATRFKGLFYPFNNAISKYSGMPYREFRDSAMRYFQVQVTPGKMQGRNNLRYLTLSQKRNVVDYKFPQWAGNDSIIVSKSSLREPPSFYLLLNGKEKRIRVKRPTIDDHFSYRNGKIVYASFKQDTRYANRDFSVLQVIDVATGKERQLTSRSKYFSPDISPDGSRIIAVSVNAVGKSNLDLIDAHTGKLLAELPNPQNFFFTQPRFMDDDHCVTAGRDETGRMHLLEVDIRSGTSTTLLSTGFNVIGYLYYFDDAIYFNGMHDGSDEMFCFKRSEKKLFKVSNLPSNLYFPSIKETGNLLAADFTVDGFRLVSLAPVQYSLEEVGKDYFGKVRDLYTPKALSGSGAGILDSLSEQKHPVTAYHKVSHLFSFHSRRPVIADPEYGYSIYSDDVLGNLSNVITYTYNRNEKSSNIAYNLIYGGIFPLISMGVEGAFHRSFDTAVGKSFSFNSAKLHAGLNIPLNFTGGRFSKYLNMGGSYNLEQFYYPGVGKKLFNNRAFKYGSYFLSVSNVYRQSLQQVAPRWAQSLSVGYRDAFNLRSSHKFVANSNFYFPGIFKNHSTLVQVSFQKRDSFPDIFSNNFSFSRGYDALSTRKMYKIGINYQLPLLYPDIGFGNIIFFQRVRLNSFYDHTVAHARLGGTLTDITNRSTGAELYFDTKLWNALPVSFGVRYSHLLDSNLRQPGIANRWEFIIPVGFIPN